ncbi:hypothetical protein ACROYT_G025683 [Oculina patagonica]
MQVDAVATPTPEELKLEWEMRQTEAAENNEGRTTKSNKEYYCYSWMGMEARWPNAKLSRDLLAQFKPFTLHKPLRPLLHKLTRLNIKLFFLQPCAYRRSSQDTKVQDDIGNFLDRFQEQTSQFPVTVRLSLLEQQCIGEWPRSVLSFCRGTEGFAEKPPEEQLKLYLTSLRKEFQEPTDSKCRRLASELSAMKQDPSESVDEFAFKYKNILHQLDPFGYQSPTPRPRRGSW